jgi:excisionase family DNA binding protein
MDNPFDLLEDRMVRMEQKLDEIKALLISAKTAVPAKEDIMKLSELSQLLGLTKATIYGFTAQGKIPCFKGGKRLLFSRKAIDVWLKSGRPDVRQEEIERSTDAIIAAQAKKKRFR